MRHTHPLHAELLDAAGTWIAVSVDLFSTQHCAPTTAKDQGCPGSYSHSPSGKLGIWPEHSRQERAIVPMAPHKELRRVEAKTPQPEPLTRLFNA
ncbi:hypothetical protein [Glutamicibacter sp. BW77]|uniref:hypothetical protein n=1 Tax=Glutamicibacter TaxID=1742989 RepID=UPI001144E2D5|nr:hypothetical protein [Glutamicibacter sp. BW77]